VDTLVIIGLILAFVNPVIGGVLVGYIVWLSEPTIGLQLMVLSLTVMSLYVIGFIVWVTKKLSKMEKRLELIERKAVND
jgi:hypothetical protein